MKERGSKYLAYQDEQAFNLNKNDVTPRKNNGNNKRINEKIIKYNDN